MNAGVSSYFICSKINGLKFDLAFFCTQSEWTIASPATYGYRFKRPRLTNACDLTDHPHSHTHQ